MKEKIKNLDVENGIIQNCKYKNYTIFNPLNLKTSDIQAMTYIRKWNLTNINTDLLVKYNLCNLEYIYIGQTGEKNFKDRSYKWKSAILKNSKHVEQEIKDFYRNYKKLMINEFGYKSKQFDRMFFYESEVDLYLMSSIEQSKEFESTFLNTYIHKYLNNLSCSYPINTYDSDYKINKNREIIKHASYDKMMLDDLQIIGLMFALNRNKEQQDISIDKRL